LEHVCHRVGANCEHFQAASVHVSSSGTRRDVDDFDAADEDTTTTETTND
jgi:hypothetical protein